VTIVIFFSLTDLANFKQTDRSTKAVFCKLPYNPAGKEGGISSKCQTNG